MNDTFNEFDTDEDNPEVLHQRFERAASHLPQILAKSTPKDEELLYLYARFKRATEGRCNLKKPGFLEFQARKKWDAWKSLDDLNPSDAKTEYIEKISQLDPEWNSEDTSQPQKKDSWIAVSCMLDGRGDELPDDEKSVYDWCKNGDLNMLKKTLNKNDINLPDEMGLTLLHWACDRGFPDIVRLLLSVNADIDVRDEDGQTPLHYACSCGYRDVVKVLLENRADTTIADSSGETAVDVAEDDDIKKLLSGCPS